LLTIAIIALLGCGPGEHRSGPALPNVLVVTVDTTRADQLGSVSAVLDQVLIINDASPGRSGDIADMLRTRRKIFSEAYQVSRHQTRRRD
jgi:hypothetical protein